MDYLNEHLGDRDLTLLAVLQFTCVGTFSCWSPEATLTVKDVYDQYEPLPRLKGDAGSMGAACNRSELWDTSQCVLTTTCKYPEVAAAWVNFLNEPEMAVTTNWGAVSETYYRGEATGLLRFPLDESGNFILPEGCESYNDVRQNGTPAQGGIIVLNDYYDTVAEYTYDAVAILAGQRANGKDEVLSEDTPTPPVPMTPEEQAAYTQILPQIQNIVKSFMASSILDGGINDNWASYEQQLEDAGLSQMLTLFQSAYDRYLATYNEYANK